MTFVKVNASKYIPNTFSKPSTSFQWLWMIFNGIQWFSMTPITQQCLLNPCKSRPYPNHNKTLMTFWHFFGPYIISSLTTESLFVPLCPLFVPYSTLMLISLWFHCGLNHPLNSMIIAKPMEEIVVKGTVVNSKPVLTTIRM